jgi:phosphoglucomutase
LKFNAANGGPAPEGLTDLMFQATQEISRYFIADFTDVDLKTVGQTRRGDLEIEIVDPVKSYKALMETLFDFDAIRALL